tara:strand:- start:38 stop:385 length:348 start_codon:yes stop_codon:yes gene_type:complete
MDPTTFMTIAITSLLILISITLVGLPLWSRKNHSDKIVDTLEEIEEISRRSRERIYEEIRILQQEYFLKNISPSDYTLQLDTARKKAAELLLRQQEAKTVIDNIYMEIDQKFNNA